MTGVGRSSGACTSSSGKPILMWLRRSSGGSPPTQAVFRPGLTGGIICTGETYKGKVKLTFAKGAKLDDPKRLFNGSLNGGTMRAIDIGEGDEIDGEGFKELVEAAIALNVSKGAQ